MVDEGRGGKLGKLHFGSPRLSFPLSASRLVSSLCLCVSIKNAFAAFAICNFTLCRRCPHSPLLPHPLPFACLHQSIYTVIPYHNGFARLCIFIFFCSSRHLPDLLWVSFCVLLQLLDSFFRIRVPDEYLMPPSLFFLRSLSLCLHLLHFSSVLPQDALSLSWAWWCSGKELSCIAWLLRCYTASSPPSPHFTCSPFASCPELGWSVCPVGPSVSHSSVMRLSALRSVCSSSLYSSSVLLPLLRLAFACRPHPPLLTAHLCSHSTLLSLSHVCCLSSPWRVN